MKDRPESQESPVVVDDANQDDTATNVQHPPGGSGGDSYDSEEKLGAVHPWRQFVDHRKGDDATPFYHSGRIKRLRPASQETLSPLTLTPRAPSRRDGRSRVNSMDDPTTFDEKLRQPMSRRFSEMPKSSAPSMSDLIPLDNASSSSVPSSKALSGGRPYLYEFNLWKKPAARVIERRGASGDNHNHEAAGHPCDVEAPHQHAWEKKTSLKGSLARLVLTNPNNHDNNNDNDVAASPFHTLHRKPRSASMQDDMCECELTRSNSPDFKYLHRFFGDGRGDRPTRIKWKRGELIGEGTFGKVYKALNSCTGELFAVKQIEVPRDKKHENESKMLAKLGEEIALMKDLRHEHIVRYQGTDRDAHFFYIFMEYVPGGSIASMLAQYDVFNLDLIRKFTRQILLGVEYLHSKSIIHRDVKGANVLVNEQGVAKLADFGCSKQLSSVKTTSMEESLRSIRGSVPWMAPEVVKQSGHDFKADIWSVGATVIEMATAKHPWPANTNHLSVMFHLAINPTGPPIPDWLPDVVKSFLQRCFCIDPNGESCTVAREID
ncbi:STE/STE11 protein kinase, variant 1 [Aphanomyces invadans]|uniref:STE/STE11 protein kinase, variant 1 n=1 Tax=Aphanomyces invadans TaxID=157072 RepID=A0A024U1A3_9STRA|nr:STE/STE11 protein kinase, variant 1 [Aphanomyces invadans]ETV99377.1 STE/STE11 protein kinase, variant 1 [Aphanomyces invadans]|eukprot:XP_008871933.1 STE/STE11 protein kinase, variant 1 [Aphanomyces invadans]